MTKRKNLSKEDLDDVSIYESSYKSSINNKIRLLDIPINVKCLNERQKELKKAIEQKTIIISTGSAGCGKTYLSLLTALHLLKTEPIYSKLVLVKSLQVIKGEEMGFLPGTLEEKMAPYMYSFTGNLDKIFKAPYITKALMDQKVIEVLPIAFIRGVTVDNCMLPGTTITLSNSEEIEIEKLYDLFLENIDKDNKFFVKSFNFNEHKVEDKELTQISKNPIINDDIYEIILEDGRKIKLTGDHKLYVKDKGYVEVKNLTEFDKLINID